jgi:hypothetical protein
MLPILIPILSALASNGLGILAGAIQAKGKEVIEEKLGVKIPEAPSGFTPEVLKELKEKEMEHEEFLKTASIKEKENELEAEKSASIQVTSRWQADMNSDSYLAKNIRPMTLIFILSVYTIFALLSAAGISITQAYVELLAQWGMLVMSAYFVGRTVEKVVDSKQRMKENSNE